jgi:ribonuclease P protein subunit POP4
MIGAKVKVVKSSNASNKMISGVVVDETKNMFIIMAGDGEKKMIKRQSVFEFESRGKTFLIDGRLLEKRPEEKK